ncbi:MAG TPA: hypothetical protein VI006_04495 [Solirubrobacteraceae bacterium]
MILVWAFLMLVHMPRRTKKSSSTVVSALEMSLCADAGDEAGRQAEHLEEWRVAAKELASAYKAWCAASWRDRRRCYLSFVDAFVWEEMTARRVQRGASALAATHAASRHA